MTRLHNSRARLLIGASVIALGSVPFAAPVFAQTAPAADAAAPAPAATVTAEVVVVTARRKALQTATERKKNADTIIDSIVADDAGKLPDTSLTEVLQRVAGVTITRFASLGSPDQFSFEGTGIQVRGLSGVTGLLNGREIYSANGGSGLNWGDVTPELMAAVDVYKESQADLLEGGLGGAVDLRTRMPFDYKKPEVDVSASASYSDFAQKTGPSASILATDRWDTPIGEVGALVDLSYSQFYYADSFARTEPYYQEEFQGKTVYVPGGFDWGNDEFNRQRKGLYLAFQWKPNADLSFWQTDFVSNYHQTNSGGGVFAVYGSNINVLTPDPVTSTTNNSARNVAGVNAPVFNSLGVFQSGSLGGGTESGPGIYPGNANNYTPSDNTTADFSEGFTWTPTQKLRIQGAAQIVEAGTWSGDYGLGIGSPSLYRENLNVGSVKLPSFNFNDPNTAANSCGQKLTPQQEITTTVQCTQPQIGVNDIVWNDQRNHAQLGALNLDVDYDLGDGFFKEVKAGVRYASRHEKDTFNGTWWSPTDRGWNGAPQQYVTTPPASNASDFGLYTFPNFFKGKLSAPSPYWFFTNINPGSFQHDVTLYTAKQGPNGGPDTITFGNAPNDVTTNTQTTDAYLQTKFGHDQIGWLPPFTGNFGIRVVSDSVQSIGTFSVNGNQLFYPTLAAANAGFAALGGAAGYDTNPPQITTASPLPDSEFIPSTTKPIIRKETYSYTRALPDFNLNFKPNSQWVIRFAADQTISPPSYNDVRATGSTGLNSLATNPNNSVAVAYAKANNLPTPQALPGIFQGYSYNSGDTRLKPQISTNEDISVEWYPNSGTTAHVDVFHKDIKELIVYNSYTFDESFNPNAGPALAGTVSGTGDFNAAGSATITGYELGGRTYFDKLPGALKGLGIEANYTYIDSKSPGNLGYDANGVAINNLPIVGLSQSNYNINLLYDLGKWDARLAYSWRSKYLATTTGNGTSTTYTPNTGPRSGMSTQVDLPVFINASGQLDGSVSYKVTDNLSVSFDGSNLLNNITRDEMELFAGEFVTRSWWINDVRYTFSVRAKF